MQTYLNTLHKRNEITLEDKNLMRPKFGQIRPTHGLPKIHKDDQDIPTFRPIVDTTNTTHYGIAKFLSSLHNPLAINNYSVKDSFEQLSMYKPFLLNYLIRGKNSLASMSPHCLLMSC